jgi:hypothetical protein
MVLFTSLSYSRCVDINIRNTDFLISFWCDLLTIFVDTKIRNIIRITYYFITYFAHFPFETICAIIP